MNSKTWAIITCLLLVVIVALSLQIVYLNKVITFSGNQYVAEISKNVDCQNSLGVAQMELQRALKSQ